MRRSRLRIRLLAIFVLFVSLTAQPGEITPVAFTRTDLFGINRETIANVLSPHAQRNVFPTRLSVESRSQTYEVDVHYTFLPRMQDALQDLFLRYRPDYATFVAMDPANGAVVAMMSYAKDDKTFGNLALRSSYPAASVFKVVTAGALLDRGVAQPDTVVPYNGRRSTLYRGQVLRHRNTKWTRQPTLQKAFAESINTVFARLGVFELGAPLLSDYATRFGFNRDLRCDLKVETSEAEIPDDQWSVAEAASGYTRSNTMSPMHGMMIASAAVNGGRMAIPHVVAKMTDAHGIPIYASESRYAPTSISPEAADKLRKLMSETVRTGSARNAFHKFYVGPLKNIDVGGKTGSLTGWSPAGRYDWFVGYAQLGERKLTFAAMIINKERWTVKSSYLARRMIEEYFRP